MKELLLHTISTELLAELKELPHGSPHRNEKRKPRAPKGGSHQIPDNQNPAPYSRMAPLRMSRLILSTNLQLNDNKIVLG